MNIFNLFKKKDKNLTEIIEKELNENISVLESLRDYDQGKKDISTTELEQRLRDIRVAP